MFAIILLLQSVTSINQSGGITAGNVPSVTVDGKGHPVRVLGYATSATTTGEPYLYRCKDGRLPGPPKALITKCRAEFLGLPSDTEWYNPYPGVVVRYDGHCTSMTQWSKSRGGDNRFYDDPDFTASGRPVKGAKPCPTWR